MKKTIGILMLGFLMATSLFAQEYNGNIKKTTPTSDFVINGDGTVTHKKTGLMWKVASEGQTWNTDGTVTGSAQTFTWAQAKSRAIAVNSGTVGQNHGYTDWRVPTIKELASIVELAAYNPSVNLEIFPNCFSSIFCSSYYWSATELSSISGYAWVVYFNDGSDDFKYKDEVNYVRLVRE